MNNLNIAYGESLVAHLDNRDWNLAVQCINNNDGDIVGWNPQTDNISELLQHLRGSLDFREVTDEELAEVNKRLDTEEIVSETMLFITQKPQNFDKLNNLELRSAFEDEEVEPMMFTYLKAEGYVATENSGEETWAIDQYDEDQEQVINSFLYSSEYEYIQDCEIIGLDCQMKMSL